MALFLSSKVPSALKTLRVFSSGHRRSTCSPSSRRNTPFSTSCMQAMPVTTLVHDAIQKTLSVVILSELATPRRPAACEKSSSPFLSTTTATAPGTPVVGSEQAVSKAARSVLTACSWRGMVGGGVPRLQMVLREFWLKLSKMSPQPATPTWEAICKVGGARSERHVYSVLRIHPSEFGWFIRACRGKRGSLHGFIGRLRCPIVVIVEKMASKHAARTRRYAGSGSPALSNNWTGRNRHDHLHDMHVQLTCQGEGLLGCREGGITVGQVDKAGKLKMGQRE